MTISPIFDQLARRRPAARPVDRAATPVFASVARPTGRRTAAPLTVADLTPREREAGGAVARLLLQLLDDETAATRRWPFHSVR